MAVNYFSTPGIRYQGSNVNALLQPIMSGISENRQRADQQAAQRQNQANADRSFGFQQDQATRNAALAADRMRMAKEQHAQTMDIRQQEMGLSRQRMGMQQSQIEDERQQRLAQRAGRLTLAILNDPDEARAAANFQKLAQSVPGLPEQLQRYGMDPADWRSSARFVAAEAGLLPAATSGAKPTDDIQEYQFATQNGYTGSFEDWMARKSARGPQSLTATDRKAVLEADEQVSSGLNVFDALTRAEQLSPDAYSGFGAETRAGIVSNMAPWATPNADATMQLGNITTAQALEQLKVVFGSMPTEGERRILLDIQGAPSQPRGVREAIYARAKVAVQKRLQDAKARADALRSGTFYQPGSGPQITPQAPQTPTAGGFDGYSARKLD